MSFVYLLASKPFGTLYVGSTPDLIRRVWEHKIKAIPGFTEKYGVDRLVSVEIHESMAAAARRERQINSPRTTDQRVEASLEDRADRTGQSAVDRSLPDL